MLVGVLLKTLSTLGFTAMSLGVRAAAPSCPIAEIVFFRSAFALFVVLAWLRIQRRLSRLPRHAAASWPSWPGTDRLRRHVLQFSQPFAAAAGRRHRLFLRLADLRHADRGAGSARKGPRRPLDRGGDRLCRRPRHAVRPFRSRRREIRLFSAGVRGAGRAGRRGFRRHVDYPDAAADAIGAYRRHRLLFHLHHHFFRRLRAGPGVGLAGRGGGGAIFRLPGLCRAGRPRMDRLAGHWGLRRRCAEFSPPSPIASPTRRCSPPSTISPCCGRFWRASPFTANGPRPPCSSGPRPSPPLACWPFSEKSGRAIAKTAFVDKGSSHKLGVAFAPDPTEEVTTSAAGVESFVRYSKQNWILLQTVAARFSECKRWESKGGTS